MSKKDEYKVYDVEFTFTQKVRVVCRDKKDLAKKGSINTVAWSSCSTFDDDRDVTMKVKSAKPTKEICIKCNDALIQNKHMRCEACWEGSEDQQKFMQNLFSNYR
jgi:hypothetical protein